MHRERLVVGAAIVRHGRVLAARRTSPAALAGGWELPGGKVEPGETVEEAVAREIREELGCEVTVTGRLGGGVPIPPDRVLLAAVAELTSGEPVPAPGEHDAVRWLAAEELHSVRWLEPDRPFLSELHDVLLPGAPLPGNVGGAARVGRTVRRPTGAWTPAVHALLRHLSPRLPQVPRVRGFDECGREVLDHLPGRVVDVDTELLTPAQLAAVARWTAAFHEAAADFTHDGPWRSFPVGSPTVVGHNDLAPYNICFEGDRLVGVFDWDLAGPSTPLLELAFVAWNCVPLWRDVGAVTAAERLRLLAASYGPRHTADEILRAVPQRVRLMLDGIPAAAAAGDRGMANLMRAGEPDRSRRRLADLERRIPLVERHLA